MPNVGKRRLTSRIRLADMFCVALPAELHYLIDSKLFTQIQCLFHLSVCSHEFVRFVTRECTRFDNKDSEPKAEVRLL